MNINFISYTSYQDIEVDEIDPFEDAFGLNTEFTDVIQELSKLNVLPGDKVTQDLMDKVKKLD